MNKDDDFDHYEEYDENPGDVYGQSEENDEIKCSECGSTNLDIRTEKEIQGGPEHGGPVEVCVDYTCNDCGYKDEL